MPALLFRQTSSSSLSTIVEKSQSKPLQPCPEYDLQLKNGRLDLVLLSKPCKITPTSPDEGFESDIDSISLISSENEPFALQTNTKQPLGETDSANGGSGSDSDTETEKTNTLTEKNVNTIKEVFEKQQINNLKVKESYSLLDCICYTDVTYPDILIFVIRNETFVFKFNNLNLLKSFHTNFSTLKAVANQKVYNPTLRAPTTKFNLLQRVDNNGVTHIEITKTNGINNINNKFENSASGPSSIISIVDDQETYNKAKNDLQISKLNPKKHIVRSSSIENILDTNDSEILVKSNVGTLRKVWNSAEDLLDSTGPKRPERRRKKKPAPPPPQKTIQKESDVLAGQYVRVNVNLNSHKDIDPKRLLIKSSLNEPHPRKLQNYSSSLSTKPNFTSFMKFPQKNVQILKFENESSSKTLHRNAEKNSLYEKNGSSWTNSVPRILKKSSRSKSETRNNFQPMAYRYIDTTIDYSKNNGLFLTATGLKPKSSEIRPKTAENSSRLSFAYNNNSNNNHTNNKESIGNRLFGLSPKLRDFGNENKNISNSRWNSMSDLNFFCDKDKNNLKSVIKNNENTSGKKKNDKKVTFSAYTTVQVL